MNGFLAHYWPEASEIPAERVREIREGVVSLIETATPGIDTTPGGVLGDLHVTPASWEKAATEIAWSRFASDLQPANIRKGVVWNCDFVRGYLEAFGQDYSAPLAWSILRLTFLNDDEREIDQSTLFRIGTSDYQMRLPFEGPLYLNGTPEPGRNDRTLIRIGASRWVIDTLIQGPPSVASAEGQSAQTDRTIAGLTSANLMGPLRGGTEPTSLQEMARRLREVNNRQPSTRGGVTGMLRTRFPEIEAVSAVLSGDVEQARDSLNPILMPGGKIDVHCRGDTSVSDQLFVILPRVGGSTLRYAGFVEFPEIPLEITAVRFGGEPVSWTMVSIPTEEYPGVTASFSEKERLFLWIDGTGIPATSIEGVLSAEFEILWTLDPSLTAAVAWMKADENRVAGLDILTRGFIPYHINSLDVWYNRKAGVYFNREQARDEILRVFNLHYPGEPAGAHRIGDTMYWAGAHSVSRVVISATLRCSVATHMYPDAEDFVIPASDGDWAAFDADVLELPEVEVDDLVNFNPLFSDEDFLLSVGPRNYGWRLPGANLRLIERGVV
jgi:hypothetical protein